MRKSRIRGKEEALGTLMDMPSGFAGVPAEKVMRSGAPGRTRTRNPWVRSPVLYPLSYRRVSGIQLALGASDGVRTRDLLCHRQAP